MNLTVGKVVEKVETIVWASPREGLSLDDLMDKLRALGHTVLKVDRAGNRVKILHQTDTA